MHNKLDKAALILKYAEDSVDGLDRAFSDARTLRKIKGTTSHAEQDIFRSMLVMACAGLDSLLKQIIRDVYESLVNRNDMASGALIEHTKNRLLRNQQIDAKYLASILLNESCRKGVINIFIEEATRNSLQSVDEIAKVLNFLAINPSKINMNHEKLKQIFQQRNKIIHEMDIDFSGRGRRKRKEHNIRDTRETCKYILNFGHLILSEVDKMLG